MQTQCPRCGAVDLQTVDGKGHRCGYCSTFMELPDEGPRTIAKSAKSSIRRGMTSSSAPDYMLSPTPVPIHEPEREPEAPMEFEDETPTGPASATWATQKPAVRLVKTMSTMQQLLLGFGVALIAGLAFFGLIRLMQ